jgi:transmembrane sensor
VKKGDVAVTVLGTSFNVNAYEDEDALRVTLVEGSVKVSNRGSSAILKPGEQAVATTRYSPLATSSADVAAAVAWKNGFFSFRGTDIKGIMRQLSRWYDVDVLYQGAYADRTFTGKIDRSLTLLQVLKGLEDTKMHFRIEEGKKLIVLP